MIHSSHRDRKAKAIAEVLAMIANAYPPLAPHRPRPVLETEEWLFESATEFIEALEKCYAERTQIKRKNQYDAVCRFPGVEPRNAPRAQAPQDPAKRAKLSR